MKTTLPTRGRRLSWSIPLPLRFILPLAAALTALAYAVVPLVDSLTLRWFVRDLDIRGNLIAGTLQEPLQELIPQHNTARIASLFNSAMRDERLFGLLLCDAQGTPMVRTGLVPESMRCTLPDAPTSEDTMRSITRLPQGPLHVVTAPIDAEGKRLGYLQLLHDMSFVERRSQDTRLYIIGLFAVLGVVIALITVAVAQMSWRGWMSGVRGILRGEGLLRPISEASPEMQPLVGDLRALLRTLDEDRRLRDDRPGGQWTPERLKGLLREYLLGDEVIVVSNREPYIHQRDTDGHVSVHRPASGLVTAVEPVMRACSGTWIAHGSGNGDRKAVDAHDRVAVPPEAPSYTLRRVWITEEEERGYYYGFANEGLWPLCHIAHVRPVFRASDWEEYRRVNARFADAVVAEADTADPVVLVQDYHFALLPRMIRDRLPQATIITFWHIPWPNPESFGICPWREELLDGLLGSSVVGFHTPFHCRNFIETVDRYLESRIEHEHSVITHNGQSTLVQDYPISIHWPAEQEVRAWPSIGECRQRIRQRLHAPAERRIALGVDRLDYTKGILERLLAVEHLLQAHPSWIGRFTFVQIAAPTRSALDEYREFEAKVRALAQRINERFGTHDCRPIELLVEHHPHQSVMEHFRAADVCVVTSLHDGMNLVAKEFVSARDDDQGVLILSQFAGAAGEMREALVVNPYYVEQVGEALHQALTMPSAEQAVRMRTLRTLVRESNIYRWAGRMLLDASRLRQRERVTARIDAQGRAPLRRVV